MTAQQREEFGKYFAARAIAFCSLFYLYIWLWVDPLLLYHVQEPPFFFGWNFFADLAAYPGSTRRATLAMSSLSRRSLICLDVKNFPSFPA